VMVRGSSQDDGYPDLLIWISRTDHVGVRELLALASRDCNHTWFAHLAPPVWRIRRHQTSLG